MLGFGGGVEGFGFRLLEVRVGPGARIRSESGEEVGEAIGDLPAAGVRTEEEALATVPCRRRFATSGGSEIEELTEATGGGGADFRSGSGETVKSMATR
jgi:hypothetical protein